MKGDGPVLSSHAGAHIVTLVLIEGGMVQINGMPARLERDTRVTMRAENVPLAFGQPEKTR